jgi:hypothetical protein
MKIQKIEHTPKYHTLVFNSVDLATVTLGLGRGRYGTSPVNGRNLPGKR